MIGTTLQAAAASPGPPPPSSDPLVGRVIQGRYRVVKPLGRGGMGLVYEAHHVLTRRKVALKTLSARASFSPGSWARFQREAQAAVAADSAHVVDVLDMGEVEDGLLYIVLEHLEGADLAFTLARDGRFSVARALNVLMQLCDALAAVHAAGIVHRDLKPENIFLIERHGVSDFVKVLDFGVCKFDAAAGRLTATGDTVGTPPFMAPEQVEGRVDLDHRADIYALGAILFFLLTGRPPFEDQSLPRLFTRICREAPPSLREIDATLPAGIDRIVQRALEKQPAARYQSCAELKAALLPFAESVDTPPRPLPMARPSRDARRSETQRLIRELNLHGIGFWTVVSVIGALLVVGLVSLVALGRGASPTALPTEVDWRAPTPPQEVPVSRIHSQLPGGVPDVTPGPSASAPPAAQRRRASRTPGSIGTTGSGSSLAPRGAAAPPAVSSAAEDEPGVIALPPRAVEEAAKPSRPELLLELKGELKREL